MNRNFIIYFFIAITGAFIFSCRQAKYVPEGDYLLKDNEIRYIKKKKQSKIKYTNDHPLLDEGSMQALIRPEPNRAVKLFFYNRIDTTKHKKQVQRKKEK